MKDPSQRTHPRRPIPATVQPSYAIGETAARPLLGHVADPARPVHSVVLPSELHPETPPARPQTARREVATPRI